MADDEAPLAWWQKIIPEWFDVESLRFSEVILAGMVVYFAVRAVLNPWFNLTGKSPTDEVQQIMALKTSVRCLFSLCVELSTLLNRSLLLGVGIF